MDTARTRQYVSVRPLTRTLTARYRVVSSIGVVSTPLPPEIGRKRGRRRRGRRKARTRSPTLLSRSRSVARRRFLPQAGRRNVSPCGEKERGDKRKRRKKKKYLVAVLACELPACPRRPRVDREPSSPAGRPRDVAALAAHGQLSSSPCAGRETEATRRLVFMHGRARRCLVFPREDEASLVLQLRDEAHLVFPRGDEAAPRFPAGRRSVTSSSSSGMRQCLVFPQGRGVA
ncbi:hypothetical protein BHM03_00026789 [Ensete ventricosum]|nr:hypothetical protein BHM03_00026789 [Ensete ventricosum]